MRGVLLAAALAAAVPGAALAEAPAVDVAAAMEALAGARDTAGRMAAIGDLGRSRDPKAVEPLLAALRDPKRDVRWAAIEALGELGDRRAVPPLIQYLRRKEAYRWGKRLVANALGAIGGGEAVEALTGLLADADPFVRRVAALAILRRGDATLLGRLAEVLRENPDDHLASVKREFARVRNGAGGAAAVAGRAPSVAPLRPHEWVGLKVGSTMMADAAERLGTPLQRTADSLLFRGDQAPSPLRTESLVLNAAPDGVLESIFVFPVWGTLDRDVRAMLGHGRLMTYGEFLRITGRTASGAGTRADGKLHYLPPDLLTESFPELGMLVVYDSADVSVRDRLVKIVIVY